MVSVWPDERQAPKALASAVDTGQGRPGPNSRPPRDFAVARIGNVRTSPWGGSNGQPVGGYLVHPVCPCPHRIELRNLQKRMASRHLRSKNWSGAQSNARKSRESMDGRNTGRGSRYVSLSICIEIQGAARGNAHRILDELADVQGHRLAAGRR